MRPTSLLVGIAAFALAIAASAAAGRAAAEERAATLAPILVEGARVAEVASDPTASVATIESEELRRSPSRSLDDVLRSIPGFSLFRRTSSRAAHPTAQGVSLRGIGPSGSSRALVLVDGVPVNDPFGGWIHWSRLPSLTVERVDVVRGSLASLWGNYAMGGIVSIETRAPSAGGHGAAIGAGERGAADFEAFAARRGERLSLAVDGRVLRDGGFPVVARASRGAIDRAARSEHATVGARAESRIGPRTAARAELRGFLEGRDNGTPYTDNATASVFARSGLDWRGPRAHRVELDLFSTVQSFESTFSSVAPDRGSELPALDQYEVPSQSVGGALVWSRRDPALSRHEIAAGADALWVEGETRELFRYVDASFTRRRVAGASQGMVGAFVSDRYSPVERLTLEASLRFDYWASYDGFRRESELASADPPDARALAETSESLVSPRLGAAFAVTAEFGLRAAAYRGFRAPTLNELVRPFRVRNDITEANDTLDAEKLLGVEAGADWDLGRASLAATGFWNQLEDPVFNVTVGSGPGVVDPCGFVPDGGVCRQRRNLGRTRSAGVEVEAAVDLGHGLEAEAGYLWSDAEIRAAAADPSLVGNRVPQVPEHQASLGLRWEKETLGAVSLALRYAGGQYEDDANSRLVGEAFVVDVLLARPLGPAWEVFAAAENVFDAVVETGRGADGVVSIGAPSLVRVGVRYLTDP